MKNNYSIENLTLAVIGLGYVGLPLAVEFGKLRPVIGFDLDANRIKELKEGIDRTLEVPENELIDATRLNFTIDPEDLKSANCYIVTVPTPIDSKKNPNLSPLRRATVMVAKYLKEGDVVIYESTVFPGCTEEFCVPLLQEYSDLKYNEDFFCGYSPERINPGDKDHRLPSITKITSGSTPQVAKLVDQLYQQIITAGTHLAPTISVAEAAKVIENTQRDLNIALMNELSIIFNKMKIDTQAVLEAAETKWNFLSFRPGLVGGHCIGVDPYYLTHKSQAIGYKPEIILAGRRINDGMSVYVANRLYQAMVEKGIEAKHSSVLILGFAFKENCPDVRNTRVADVVQTLKDIGMEVTIYDPWVDAQEVKLEYGLDVVTNPPGEVFDGVVIAVGHQQFVNLGEVDIRAFGKPIHVLYDLKYVLSKQASDIRL